MSEIQPRIIRRHKTHKGDGKGERRYIAGVRFRCPKDTPPQEADRRFLLIEQVWRDNEAFCQRMDRPLEWNSLVSGVADAIRLGARRVPLPDLNTLFEFFPEESFVSAISRFVIENEAEVQSGEVAELDFDQVINVLALCQTYFPSVPWQLPPRQHPEIAAFHEQQSRYSTRKFAEATGAKPPDPKTPVVHGTLHEALAEYRKERVKEIALPDGSIDATGHFLVGLVDSLPKVHPDIPLNMLDLARCKELIDHWRYRPPSERGDKAPLSAKVCRERLRQLDLFFRWLHLTDKYAWRKPADFSELDWKVRSLPSDKRSIRELQIPTFNLEELSLIYRHASRFERLLLVWCLNCSFGAAEIGRICWEDLFLRQQHPWTPQGLKVGSTKNDSWCGLLRPKTAVLGWWWLFPETVQLLDWWRENLVTGFGQEPKLGDRIVLTGEGTSLYRDLSKNSQSGFNNMWTSLLKRVNNSLQPDEKQIRPLPFGTLRNQLSDWLGGDQNNAVLGSLALAHGVPHKGDDLLYKHYANKPWSAFFAAQRRWREHLQSMFGSGPDVLAEIR
jgi:integrase